MIAEAVVLGTLCKYLADYLKLRRDRKKGAAAASLDDFRDWLRRQEHQQEVELLLDSQEMQREVGKLIKSRQRRTVRQISDLLEPLAAQLAGQKAQLGAIDTYVRQDLPVVLGERVGAQLKLMLSRTTPSEEDRAFEAGPYAKAILATLDEVELYGADLSAESRQQQLSVAYISLNLGSLGEAGASGPRPAADALAQLPLRGGRLLIRGEAGSGKSTLLRWIAVQWAQSTDKSPALTTPLEWVLATNRREMFPALSLLAEAKAAPLSDGAALWNLLVPGAHWSDSLENLSLQWTTSPPPLWRRQVPLLIRVRDCKDGILPLLDAIPATSLPTAGSPPSGWTQRLLNDHRALVLIDGVDEIAPKHRATLRKQIQGLVNTYRENLYVVTTRPGAVAEDWLAGLNFEISDIAPMTADDRARFVDKWHEAVQSEVSIRHKTEDVIALADRLKAELASNPPVARLATNPLLAAMICALHRDRRSKLPESQYELVEALCHMLLYRREYESGLDLTAFPEEYRNLTYPQRRGILQRLAAYMIDEAIWSLNRKLATKRIEEELQTIPDRSPRDAKIVLQSLVERSGMLREHASGELDFIHNTFKEFLAARQYAQKDALKKLGELALDSDLEQVPLFAAATPEHDGLATQLITRVLGKDDGAPSPRRREPTTKDVARYRSRLMAVRLAAVAQRLDRETEQRVRALRRRVFPPRTLAAAAALAACGSGSERYLKRDPRMPARGRVCCVRALRLLETDVAQRELEAYRDETDWAVIEELSQAVNPLRIPEVVRQLSSERLDRAVMSAQRSVRSRIVDLSPLTRMPQLRHLWLDRTAVTDLTPLAGLSRMETLSLIETGVTDLTPLVGLTELRFLLLDRTGVTDLRPLARSTQLEALWLDKTGVTDLSTLAGLPALRALSLNQTAVTDLTRLEGLTELQSLYLDKTSVTDLKLLMGLSQLRTLSLSETGVTDLSPLEGLTELQSLYLDKTSVTDLKPLAALAKLQLLWLSEMGVTDLRPLAGLNDLREVWLNGTGVTDLRPLVGLKELRELWLDGTGVTDLTPLAGLTQLRRLESAHTAVADLTPLVGLTGLQSLWLGNTGVTGLTPLANLRELHELWLRETRVTDLGPLAGLTQLRKLDLAQTGVTDLSPLAGLTQLQSLDIYMTHVTDLTPLRTLSSVKVYVGSRRGLRIPTELRARVHVI